MSCWNDGEYATLKNKGWCVKDSSAPFAAGKTLSSEGAWPKPREDVPSANDKVADLLAKQPETIADETLDKARQRVVALKYQVENPIVGTTTGHLESTRKELLDAERQAWSSAG